jgi:hypothetical protein
VVLQTIIATIRHADGTPWANAPVTWQQIGTFAGADSTYPIDDVTSTTNALGVTSQALAVPDDPDAAARYCVVLPGGAMVAFNLSAAVGDVYLEDLVILALTTADPNSVLTLIEAHTLATTTAHGGVVSSADARLTDARTPTGAAGGALGGTYPNPSFAADMATQAELDAHTALTTSAHGGIVKPPLAMSFSGNGDIYFVAHESLTLTTPTEAGTGTLAYTRALAAAPTSFSTLTFPGTLAIGDILKVTLSGISGYKAATLPRSA